MGKTGPKTKPTALKRLQGNPGRRPLPANEPQPDRTMPRCPGHLGAEAKREWRRVAKKLHNAGILSNVDRAVLAAYCQVYGRWVQAEIDLREKGVVVLTTNGNPIKNPQLNVADKALDQILKFSREFGLTPSSRAGLVVGEDGPEWSLADELLAAVELGRAKHG